MTSTLNVPRTFAFIDGENLVMRYQALVSDGRKPRESVRHAKDVYVWCHDQLFLQGHFDVVRAYYFTSMVGDEPSIRTLESEIEALPFSSSNASPVQTMLYARVFKKPKQSQKSKNVDLGIAAEMLMHSYEDHLDAALLFSGDGDLAPVASKVANAGKRIIVWAFRNGFDEALSRYADRTFFLENVFFEPEA